MAKKKFAEPLCVANEEATNNTVFIFFSKNLTEIVRSRSRPRRKLVILCISFESFKGVLLLVIDFPIWLQFQTVNVRKFDTADLACGDWLQEIAGRWR